MTFSVTIEKQITETSAADQAPAPVRFTVVATIVIGFGDLGVFVYELDQVTGEEVYSHVAVPTDLQDYNYNIIGDKNYVRKASIDLYRDTASEAEVDISEIEDRLQLLCNDMQALTDFGSVQTTVITSS